MNEYTSAIEKTKNTAIKYGTFVGLAVGFTMTAMYSKIINKLFDVIRLTYLIGFRFLTYPLAFYYGSLLIEK